MSDALKVPYGDGVSAIARTSRAIVLLTAQALEMLCEMGYRRGRHTAVETDPEGMPVWVTLGGRRAYEVDFVLDEGTVSARGLTVAGRWLIGVRRRSWPVRLWYRIGDWLSRKGDVSQSSQKST